MLVIAEDMSLPSEDGAETLRLAVDIVECLGSDQYLYGKVGGVRSSLELDRICDSAAG